MPPRAASSDAAFSSIVRFGRGPGDATVPVIGLCILGFCRYRRPHHRLSGRRQPLPQPDQSLLGGLRFCLRTFTWEVFGSDLRLDVAQEVLPRGAAVPPWSLGIARERECCIRTAVEPWVVEAADRLASRLRELVLPHLGTMGSRALTGRAPGGDTTFAIDERAERETVRFLEQLDRPAAVYTEDRGMLSWGDAEYVLIVDPIDGTRPAMAGLEACCVSIAVARCTPRPTMADVVYGIVAEIKEGGIIRAVRGAGVSITGADGRPVRSCRQGRPTSPGCSGPSASGDGPPPSWWRCLAA